MLTRLIPAALALTCGLLAPGPAHGQVLDLEYQGRAYGVLGLGRARVQFALGDGGAYTVSATLRSGGLWALFEPTTLNASSTGHVEPSGPVWRSYVLDHAYSAKRRQITMTSGPEGVEARITPTYRLWGEPATSESQKRLSRDPLSSLLAMSLDVGQTRRCEGSFPTFDGRFHYALELSEGDLRAVEEGSFTGQALRCRLRYVPIAGFEPRDAGGRDRIPSGHIWFAVLQDMAIAPPIRVTAPLPLGQVGIYLRDMRRPLISVAPTEPSLPDETEAPWQP